MNFILNIFIIYCLSLQALSPDSSFHNLQNFQPNFASSSSEDVHLEFLSEDDFSSLEQPLREENNDQKTHLFCKVTKVLWWFFAQDINGAITEVEDSSWYMVQTTLAKFFFYFNLIILSPPLGATFFFVDLCLSVLAGCLFKHFHRKKVQHGIRFIRFVSNFYPEVLASAGAYCTSRLLKLFPWFRDQGKLKSVRIFAQVVVFCSLRGFFFLVVMAFYNRGSTCCTSVA